MTIDDIVVISRDALYTICITSAPVLLVSLVVGLIISIFQTVTSIQEQTLTFVPKVLAIFVALLICGRTKNIENIIERVKTAPTVNQIFGYGFMGHAAKYHKMVDVEVFAILYYYGIVGWLVYIVIHIWLIRKICYLYRIRDVIGSNVLSSYSTCYSILIFYSIAAEPFSYLFFFCLIFVYLGFIEAYLNEYYNIV